MNKSCRELAPDLSPPECRLRLGVPALPQQAFLGDGSDQGAVERKDQAARKAARVGEARAVLGVEQPFVGAERAGKPQRVVEAPPPPPPRPHAPPPAHAGGGGATHRA